MIQSVSSLVVCSSQEWRGVIFVILGASILLLSAVNEAESFQAVTPPSWRSPLNVNPHVLQSTNTVLLLGDSVQYHVVAQALDSLCDTNTLNADSDWEEDWLVSGFNATPSSGRSFDCTKNVNTNKSASMIRGVGNFRIPGLFPELPYYSAWRDSVLHNAEDMPYQGFPCSRCMAVNAVQHWVEYWGRLCEGRAVTCNHFIFVRIATWDVMRQIEHFTSDISPSDFKELVQDNVKRFDEELSKFDASLGIRVNIKLVFVLAHACPKKFDSSAGNKIHSIEYLTRLHNLAVISAARKRTFGIFSEGLLQAKYNSDMQNDTQGVEICKDFVHYHDNFQSFYARSMLSYIRESTGEK